MRKRILGILRAIGVLIALWSILGVIGWIATDLPAVSPSGEGSTDSVPEETQTATAEATLDGGTGTVPDAGATRARPVGDDAGRASPAASASGSAPVARHVICDGTITRPTLRALDVIGDPRPELVVGCGAVVHVLATRDGQRGGGRSGGAFMPVRVASFDATNEASNATVHAAPAAAGDVDGDSRPDLVLGFRFVRNGSGNRGGALYLVRSDVTGAFESPRRLARIATSDVVLHPLDQRPGLDIVALKRGNELARRPGEVWIYRGGPSPARRTKLKTGIGAEALAVGDLDGDGQVDLIAVASGTPRVDAFFGDGAGSFPRSTTLSIADAREVVSGTAGANRAHAWVAAAGLHRITARAEASLRAEPVDAPPELRSLIVGSVDGRAPRALLAVAGRRLLRVTREDGEVFRTEELFRLPERAMVPRAVRLADLDANGDPDLVVLGRSAEGQPWELVVIDDPTADPPVSWPRATSPVPDAPLELRIALRGV